MQAITNFAIAFASVLFLSCQNGDPKNMNPTVTMKTSKGNIQIELFENKAPITVKNFLTYAQEGHYKKTVFHRVINGFMIQGGGFTADMQQKPTHDPIQNEACTECSNKRGTLAMARTSDIHSASAQFFINVQDNDFLDHKSKTPQGYGYCVFGKVVSGMDVVDSIKGVKTTNKAGHSDVPVEPIEIVDVVVDKK